MSVRIAKGFKFLEDSEAKTLTFHGPVILTEQYVYLVHKKHTWDSANTSMAMFGLLGALVHHFATRKRPVPYPLPTKPYAELKDHFDRVYNIGSVKDDAKVLLLPVESIQAYTKGMLKGMQLMTDSGKIALHGTSSATIDAFEQFGVRRL